MYELGWKYVRNFCDNDVQDHAYIDREKYKEGRFILEKAKLMKIDWDGHNEDISSGSNSPSS